MKELQDVAVRKYDQSVTNYQDDHNYMVLWMKSGIESVTIDFEKFATPSDSIYFITPGRNVDLDYSSNAEGWILCFSKHLFNDQIKENLVIKNIDVFSTFSQTPKIILSPKIGNRVNIITEMIDELIGSEIPNKETAIASLLKTLLIYCDSKCNIKVTQDQNVNQMYIVTQFKDLVAMNYMLVHKVSFYADMMNISSKYLNQVVKSVLGVTAKSIIQEQLIIHARRDLKFSNESIKEIAFKLGFSEPFYFSNYFKKQMGCSPSDYRHL